MSVSQNKLCKRLRRLVGKAIDDYQMIADGDRIMVCLSGGKDSYALLDILLVLQKSAPIHFEIIAVNLNQKFPNFPERVLPDYLEKLGVKYDIIEHDTYQVVMEKIPAGKTMCSLCSRLRRGILYRYAEEHGITKIALGHHKIDVIETFFLNLFFTGRLKAMPAKLLSDNKKQIVIRPLVYCDEKDIVKYAKLKAFPIIPSNLCGVQKNMQRTIIKEMLLAWEKDYPQRIEHIFAALTKTVPSHLLDTELFNFAEIEQKAIRFCEESD